LRCSYSFLDTETHNALLPKIKFDSSRCSTGFEVGCTKFGGCLRSLHKLVKSCSWPDHSQKWQ